jgi:hypothetical protein
MYELKVKLGTPNVRARDGSRIYDEITTKVAFRTIETRGDQFLLNGQPLSIRGVLNWGYYPPSLSPNPPEEVWRNDLKLIKSWGFNLMKCCLWVPPKRLLEIADEEGVLIWLEYPTWHPQLTTKYEAELLREYKEFHQHDRNHPSVILRSLTCETGPGADLGVIKKLYDQCKQMCGGLVVDDSSWIEWNRVCDFYDDHPYGNNHTWVKTLTRLKDYIAHSKLGVKPLCLGEAIAADTWVPTKPMPEAIAKAKADPKQAWSLDERGYPYWVPGFFDANQAWLKRMEKVCGGPIDEKKLEEDSLRYAWLMRKYQIETYRREVPSAGYVVSVMRDFPFAGMGLIDYQGQAKWPAGEKSDYWMWHRPSMLLMQTEQDRRSFLANKEMAASIYLSHFGTEILERGVSSATISIQSNDPGGVREICTGGSDFITQRPGSSQVVAELKTSKLPENTKPTMMYMFAFASRFAKTASEPNSMRMNWWYPWAFPETEKQPEVQLHASLATKAIATLFSPRTSEKDKRDEIIVTSILDPLTLDQLEKGGKVFLLPNGQSQSLPMHSHWFLRGAPFINDNNSLIKSNSQLHEILVCLQHFDLASDVIPDINYLEEIDPILMLWDNHDLKEVKTHGLVFETKVGKGRLLVSALNHEGETNAVGKYLLDTFLQHLYFDPPPRNALKPETIARMRAKLNEKRLDLVTKSWQFMPDGKEEGLKLGWHQPDFDDKAWKPIKIGKHWEAQGYPDLDGWAWYRLKVDIPKDWAGVPIYLNSEGVDDAYEIYFNGTKIGSGGDIPNKKTAFEERKAHAIPAQLLKSGEPNLIAIRVYDWYGSGGIHRPMTLSNIPIGGVDILK